MGTAPRFETTADVLRYYESQAPVLTPEFIAQIPWHELKKTPLDREWIDVLLYMRNVEKFTEIYYDQLKSSPSGADPAIAVFMERWKKEEDRHGELINRFLVELGAVSDTPNWYQALRSGISKRYFLGKRIIFAITNLFGKFFIGTHMSWGAINEFSTLQGYHRLARLSGHPVLGMLLKAIATEESRHAFFYYHIAQVKLRESAFAQRLAYLVLHYFWAPVGAGLMSKADTRLVIARLFGGPEGIFEFDRLVARRIRGLSGLEELRILTERIRDIALPPLNFS